MRPGGRPMPTRTRNQSRVPSLSQMERSPLCPACPPPNFTRTVPGSMSSSSWMTTRCDASTPYAFMSCFTGPPDVFM